MSLSRRELLRSTGVAAGVALIAGVAEDGPAAALADAGGGAPAAARRRGPWYELGLMPDPVLDGVLLYYLGATWQRQADVGEVLDTASRVEAGDDWSWTREWTKTAERLRERGVETARAGHRVSAGEAFMRASTYYRAALHRHPRPAHRSVPRLTRLAVGSFERSVAQSELPLRAVEIPYERTTLPAYLLRASTARRTRRAPLLIVHSGRDTWAEDCLYLGLAAAERGIDTLMFDGPGQGKVLRLQGLALRPDWERVVSPVVDWAIAHGGADPRRIALMGLSMGGALAPRAAAFEPRIKALIANPGVLSWRRNTFAQMRGYLGQQLLDLLESDPAAFDRALDGLMRRNGFLRWGVEDLMWKHGARTPSGAMQQIARFDNSDSVGRIRARSLVMDGAADVYQEARQLYDAIDAPKDYMLFTARDTGLEHVQAAASGVATQRVLDWLEGNL